MLLFLLLTIALIVYGSLYPFHFAHTARAAHPLLAVLRGWPHAWNRFVLRDVLLNVILYFPLGAAAALAALRRHSRAVSAAAAIALAFGLSACMELLQAYAPGRDPSSLDVLTNTAGGVLGAAIALSFERPVRRLAIPTGRLRAAAAILLAVWAIQEFYPVLPAIGRTHVLQSLRSVYHLRSFSLTETWLGVAEWFAVGLALESVFTRLKTAWLAGLMALALGAQMAILDRNLTAGEIAAAALALALWNWSPPAARARWCACLLGSAILLRELSPFHFLSVPHPFSWIPFAATMQSEREGAVIIITRKAFDYGAMIFALCSARWSYLPAGCAVAAALAVSEAIQTYLPGRTPEITDPLLALLMMALLMLATPRKAS